MIAIGVPIDDGDSMWSRGEGFIDIDRHIILVCRISGGWLYKIADQVTVNEETHIRVSNGRVE